MTPRTFPRAAAAGLVAAALGAGSAAAQTPPPWRDAPAGPRVAPNRVTFSLGYNSALGLTANVTVQTAEAPAPLPVAPPPRAVGPTVTFHHGPPVVIGAAEPLKPLRVVVWPAAQNTEDWPVTVIEYRDNLPVAVTYPSWSQVPRGAAAPAPPALPRFMPPPAPLPVPLPVPPK